MQESGFHQVPAMNFKHSKEGLIQQLQNNLAKSYKRGRHRRKNVNGGSNDNIRCDDMDIESCGEEDSPESPPAELDQAPPCNMESDENSSNVVPENILNTSLMELQREKEKILQALALDHGSDSPLSSEPIDKTKDVENITENDNDNDKIKSTNDQDEIMDKTLDSTVVDSDCIDKTSAEPSFQAPSTPQTICGQSRESHFGTPLIQAMSPFSKLPVGEKWSVGVSEVIDFENLPDATGTYRKMVGVIQKVRTVVKNLNEEENQS